MRMGNVDQVENYDGEQQICPWMTMNRNWAHQEFFENNFNFFNWLNCCYNKYLFIYGDENSN